MAEPESGIFRLHFVEGSRRKWSHPSLCTVIGPQHYCFCVGPSWSHYTAPIPWEEHTSLLRPEKKKVELQRKLSREPVLDVHYVRVVSWNILQTSGRRTCVFSVYRQCCLSCQAVETIVCNFGDNYWSLLSDRGEPKQTQLHILRNDLDRCCSGKKIFWLGVSLL